MSLLAAGLLGLIGSITWLTILAASGFNLLAVAAGLFATVVLLGRSA